MISAVRTGSLFLAFLTSVAIPSFAANHQELLIDAVVASVDGVPITLSDLCEQLEPPRKLSFKEASLDPEARLALDKIVLERMITAEAESRRLSVTDQEIEAYINEVAARNQMDRTQFERALRSEKRDLKTYRAQVKLDILRSRIASQMIQGGVGVTDEEVRQYVKLNPSMTQSGSKLRISQIFVSSADRGRDEAQRLAAGAKTRLEKGADFDDVARALSDGPEAREGGSLGVVAEEDLSPLIFEAIFSLGLEQPSAVVESNAGFHIFQVDQRFVQEQEASEQVMAEARRILKQQKLDVKLQTYFTSDLYKLHSVDKKI